MVEDELCDLDTARSLFLTRALGWALIRYASSISVMRALDGVKEPCGVIWIARLISCDFYSYLLIGCQVELNVEALVSPEPPPLFNWTIRASFRDHLNLSKAVVLFPL